MVMLPQSFHTVQPGIPSQARAAVLTFARPFLGYVPPDVEWFLCGYVMAVVRLLSSAVSPAWRKFCWCSIASSCLCCLRASEAVCPVPVMARSSGLVASATMQRYCGMCCSCGRAGFNGVRQGRADARAPCAGWPAGERAGQLAARRALERVARVCGARGAAGAAVAGAGVLAARRAGRGAAVGGRRGRPAGAAAAGAEPMASLCRLLQQQAWRAGEQSSAKDLLRPGTQPPSKYAVRDAAGYE